jgi:hypothetical protein
MLLLPTDLILPIFEYCDAPSLCALAQTCRRINVLVKNHAYPDYIRRNPRPSFSLPKNWSHLDQIRYSTCTDSFWSRHKFMARPLRDPWAGKLQPVMAINSTRLVIGAGETLYSYSFGRDAHIVAFEGQVRLNNENSEHTQPFPDISAVEFTSDDVLLVGFADGSLQRMEILPSAEGGSLHFRHSPVLEAAPHHQDFIENICHESNEQTLILSSSGLASLFCSREHTSVRLGRRSWTALFQSRASTPFIVFGSSSTSIPLTVHPVHSGISTRPSVALYATPRQLESPRYMGAASAVYALCCSPPSAPWGASDQIIISGWYDGGVRVYDLRSSLRTQPQNSDTTCLLPSLSFSDPWSPEPIYALSSGGGSGAHVGAGTARHSVVSFWDVRHVSDLRQGPSGGHVSQAGRCFGWSVHAPMNDSSPVYSLIMESSRVWGATQGRPFVFDFGNDVGACTYPAIETRSALRSNGRNWRDGSVQRRVIDESGRKGSEIGFYVTKYEHGRGLSR